MIAQNVIIVCCIAIIFVLAGVPGNGGNKLIRFSMNSEQQEKLYICVVRQVVVSDCDATLRCIYLHI